MRGDWTTHRNSFGELGDSDKGEDISILLLYMDFLNTSVHLFTSVSRSVFGTLYLLQGINYKLRKSTECGGMRGTTTPKGTPDRGPVISVVHTFSSGVGSVQYMYPSPPGPPRPRYGVHEHIRKLSLYSLIKLVQVRPGPLPSSGSPRSGSQDSRFGYRFHVHLCNFPVPRNSGRRPSNSLRPRTERTETKTIPSDSTYLSCGDDGLG